MPPKESGRAQGHLGRDFRDAEILDRSPIEEMPVGEMEKPGKRFYPATVLRSPSLLRRLLVPLALIFLISGAAPLWAWGQNGHRILAEIAQHRLSEGAAQAISELLGGRRLADISTEPDELRADPRWSCAAPFHYVTIPEGIQYPDAEFEGWENGDAVRGILFLSKRLLDLQVSREERATALAFLVHLVGDLHQPLHTGKGCDRGGNAIRVDWFGETRNLHSVWDTAIVESENLSYIEYTEEIERNRQLVVGMESASPANWMTEAQDYFGDIYKCDLRDGCPCFCGTCADGLSVFGGCEMAVGCRLQVSNRVRLGYRYKFRTKPIVERQLKTGGWRLAHLLNQLFGARQFPDSYRSWGEEIERIEGWDDALRACFEAAPAGER